jgi:hypothetical protein
MMARDEDTTRMLAGHPVRQHRKYRGTLELLCGDDDGFHVCREVICWIAGTEPAEPARGKLSMIVPPGYFPDRDGVYYLTNYAAANVRYGRDPGYRRPIVHGEEDKGRRRVLTSLWYRIRCPGCGTVHSLRADELGLCDPRAMPQRLGR